MSRAAAKAPLHQFGTVFYTKVAAAGFVLGAGMEMFMIKTGFYNKCAHASPTCACLARGF